MGVRLPPRRGRRARQILRTAGPPDPRRGAADHASRQELAAGAVRPRAGDRGVRSRPAARPDRKPGAGGSGRGRGVDATDPGATGQRPRERPAAARLDPGRGRLRAQSRYRSAAHFGGPGHTDGEPVRLHGPQAGRTLPEIPGPGDRSLHARGGSDALDGVPPGKHGTDHGGRRGGPPGTCRSSLRIRRQRTRAASRGRCPSRERRDA